MFKLIKWAMFGLIGYALYELYQGMMEMSEEGSESSFGQSHRGQFTGQGQGQRTTTADSSGASMAHEVGRGAV